MFTAEERRKYIGGSDIASVMMMSRWKTPLTLWLEKTGEIEPDDLSDNEAVQLGVELEDFVAHKFAKEIGKKVRKTNKIYFHKKYPFLAAHVDRLIVGSEELLECKTCSSYKQDEWKDEVIIVEENGEKKEIIKQNTPYEYVLQCIWYMGILGKKVCYIAVLIGGQKFKYRKIEFDAELFNIMVDMAVEFWNCVQTKTMPALSPEDSNTLSKVYSTHSEDYLEYQDVEEKIEKLQEVKAGIKTLDVEKKMLEAELKNIINTHAGILTDKFKVSWLSEERPVVNTERLKADNLYEKYTDKSTTRSLKVFLKQKKAA